jgi:ankyrin repeat protein
MDRRRLLEIGAAGVLLLTMLGAGGGLWYWRARQERLNASLAEALYQRDLSAVRTLLRAGAGLHTRGKDGSTPVMVAIIKRDFAFVDELLKRGAEVNGGRNDTMGYSPTALWYALQTPRPEKLVRKLLEHGADPNERNGRGCTVLVRAAQSGHTEAVRVLLDHGADIRAMPYGSILHVEKVRDTPAVVRLLKQAGAKG